MATDILEKEPKKTIGAVENAVQVVDGLQELDGAGLDELAGHLGMPRSTVHLYLKTLEQFGYVVNTDGTWEIGLRFLRHGGYARKQMKVYRAAKPEVDRIAIETGESADIGVEQNGKRVLLYKSETEGAITDNNVTGEFTYLHWTGLGKTLLAWSPREHVEKIVEAHGLPGATEETITDLDALFEELERSVERGYVIEDEDHRTGVASIGVPILEEDTHTAVGAISVTGPRNRILADDTEDELVDELQHSANVAELRYNHY